MTFERAIIKELLPGVYLIDDAGEGTCYLVCGEQQAMLIDTANGLEDLNTIVRSLTDLPVIVVDTHGHPDHIYGNVYFKEAWMHPADYATADIFFGYIKEKMEKENLHPCPLRALEIGQVFDLGGLKLEVVDLKGHTAGSIGLLDRKHRLLFSGDGVNAHLWMQLDHSLHMSELRKTLLALKANHGHEFDHVLTGHAKDFMGAEIVDILIRACDEILAGQCENDPPYHYFGGQCLQHPLSDVPGECIVYDKKYL